MLGVYLWLAGCFFFWLSSAVKNFPETSLAFSGIGLGLWLSGGLVLV